MFSSQAAIMRKMNDTDKAKLEDTEEERVAFLKESKQTLEEHIAGIDKRFDELSCISSSSAHNKWKEYRNSRNNTHPTQQKSKLFGINELLNQLRTRKLYHLSEDEKNAVLELSNKVMQCRELYTDVYINAKTNQDDFVKEKQIEDDRNRKYTLPSSQEMLERYKKERDEATSLTYRQELNRTIEGLQMRVDEENGWLFFDKRLTKEAKREANLSFVQDVVGGLKMNIFNC